MINNKQGFMACESHTSYKGNGQREVDYDDNTHQPLVILQRHEKLELPVE